MTYKFTILLFIL